MTIKEKKRYIEGAYLAFEFPLISKREFNCSESGISKKIYKQFETFELYGFRMNFYNPYLKNNILKQKIRRRLPLFFLHRWDAAGYDYKTIAFEYIRKPWFMDGDLVLHMRRLKKENPGCKIILEIPTFPYDGELHSISMKPLELKDKYWRRFLRKYVDRIVTYSDDKRIFGIPTINISNAFDMSDIKVANNKKYNPNEIHIMLCATLAYWHGYDRAIEGLHNYYKDNGTVDFILHIVGDGEETEHFKKMISDYKLDNHVIMHGKKYGNGLDEIYGLCDIAFDSMGRHRSGVTYNSSLKGKEYAAKGLPIVSGVKTELDFDNTFGYYYRIPADESPVDFNEISNFCNSIYSTESVEQIRTKIRSYAYNNYSYEIVMKKIGSYIKQ